MRWARFHSLLAGAATVPLAGFAGEREVASELGELPLEAHTRPHPRREPDVPLPSCCSVRIGVPMTWSGVTGRYRHASMR